MLQNKSQKENQTKDLVIILTYVTSYKGMSLPVISQPNQILWSEKKSQKYLCCKSLNCLSKDFVTPRNKDMHIKPKENLQNVMVINSLWKLVFVES